MQQRVLCTASASLSVFCCVCRVPAGTVDTVLSYCHYSLNDQTVADMFPYFKEKGVGIINASALSMGLLTDQASPDCTLPHATPLIRQPSYDLQTTLTPPPQDPHTAFTQSSPHTTALILSYVKFLSAKPLIVRKQTVSLWL